MARRECANRKTLDCPRHRRFGDTKQSPQTITQRSRACVCSCTFDSHTARRTWINDKNGVPARWPKVVLTRRRRSTPVKERRKTMRRRISRKMKPLNVAPSFSLSQFHHQAERRLGQRNHGYTPLNGYGPASGPVDSSPRCVQLQGLVIKDLIHFSSSLREV